MIYDSRYRAKVALEGRGGREVLLPGGVRRVFGSRGPFQERIGESESGVFQPRTKTNGNKAFLGFPATAAGALAHRRERGIWFRHCTQGFRRQERHPVI